MVSNGKSKQHRQIRCSGVFRLFRCSGCSGVFRSVPECFGVPVFLVLVHVILLTIFDNAWQNPVKWLLRARHIRSTSDANMEHAGEENSTRVFRFRVAQVCSLSIQINLPMRDKILSIDHYVTWKWSRHRLPYLHFDEKRASTFLFTDIPTPFEEK